MWHGSYACTTASSCDGLEALTLIQAVSLPWGITVHQQDVLAQGVLVPVPRAGPIEGSLPVSGELLGAEVGQLGVV